MGIMILGIWCPYEFISSNNILMRNLKVTNEAASLVHLKNNLLNI